MNRKSYRRERLIAESRHTASMFLSPVVFALRTRPLRWERPDKNSTCGIKSSSKRMWIVAKTPAVFDGSFRERSEMCEPDGYPSICCASISRLNAIRRSSATAAKYAQWPRSVSVHARSAGMALARLERTIFKRLK
jgi:hypothetical protein